MAEQGWLAVERPRSRAASGMGFVEVAVLCEQLGRHLAPVPFAGTVLASLLWTGLGMAGRPEAEASALPTASWRRALTRRGDRRRCMDRRPDQVVARPASALSGGRGC